MNRYLDESWAIGISDTGAWALKSAPSRSNAFGSTVADLRPRNFVLHWLFRSKLRAVLI